MQEFLQDNWWLVLGLAVWTILWKGFALWKAASKQDKVWFWVLLVINTAGILEILYIFYFSKLSKPAKA